MLDDESGCAPRRSLFHRLSSSMGWLLLGAVLTISLGQYQGSIEVRFGDLYLKVKGQPSLEATDPGLCMASIQKEDAQTK